MKTLIKNGEFNTCLDSSDWRYSAAILGLIKYFKYLKKDDVKYKITEDSLFYNSEDLTEDRYLEFVEEYYGENLHHINILNMLSEDSFSDESIKIINEKMSANSILKKMFKNIKFNGTNKEKIIKIINDNRNEIIKSTFINKNDLYKNYCNDSCFGNEKGDCCRLQGYYIDFNKKGKAASYNFNKINFKFEDEKEFDYIPFAFCGPRKSFFINDSISIEQLQKTNNTFKQNIEIQRNKKDLNGKLDSREVFFRGIIESKDFIDYDIEVITKNQENDFFETLYIRKENIDVLRSIKDFYDIFLFSVQITENYWINIQQEVVKCILNNIRTDRLIDMFLKKGERQYVVSKLIKVNLLLEKGGNEMEKKTKIAYACAKKVASAIETNKLASYRQKLTSAIVFRDYDRVCDILLQLSNYSKVDFDFAFDLFEDFEKNKDVAYSFINALTKKKEGKDDINE